jgi:pyrroloquinoline quinone biosynthesis protein D
MTARLTIHDVTRPALARHARLRFDETRQLWVILAPERVLLPDDIAVEVLQLCDGARDLISIASTLAAKYDAPVSDISSDVRAMLQDLADRGFVVDAREAVR